jgi:putative Mn2+ efflux pump MntP
LILGFILGTAALVGAIVMGMLALATRLAGAWSAARFHHLAQALIPLAGAGVFLGLSMTTVTMLAQDGFDMHWVAPLRAAILAGAALWSLWLGWRIAGRYADGPFRRSAATASLLPAIGLGVAAWSLLFWG